MKTKKECLINKLKGFDIVNSYIFITFKLIRCCMYRYNKQSYKIFYIGNDTHTYFKKDYDKKYSKSFI